MRSAYPDQRGVKPYRTWEKTEADARVKTREMASDLIRVAAEDVMPRPMEGPLLSIFDVKAELVRKKGKVLSRLLRSPGYLYWRRFW